MNESKKDDKKDDVLEPVLDRSRPHFSIGYKEGSEDELVIERGPKGVVVDELEVGVMLTHAQAVNTLGFFNRLRVQQERVKSELKESLAKDKLKGFKDKRKKKEKPLSKGKGFEIKNK